MKRREWLRNVASASLLFAMTGCANGNKQTEASEVKTETPVAGVKTQTGVTTREFGQAKVTWIRDNAKERIMNNSLFVGADSTKINEWSPQGGAPASVSVVLVESEGKRILVDTGNGVADSLMLPGLASIGVKPEDIDYLYITHFHGDHLGGMMNGEQVVFPNAQVYVSTLEYDAWMTSPALEKRREQAAKIMGAYQERLHKFSFGETLPGNVLAIDAVGHTPGHTAYLVDKCLIIGDLLHGAALQIPHPELCATFDMDREKAVETRKRLLAEAKSKGFVLTGMHLPEPGFIESW